LLWARSLILAFGISGAIHALAYTCMLLAVDHAASPKELSAYATPEDILRVSRQQMLNAVLAFGAISVSSLVAARFVRTEGGQPRRTVLVRTAVLVLPVSFAVFSLGWLLTRL